MKYALIAFLLLSITTTRAIGSEIDLTPTDQWLRAASTMTLLGDMMQTLDIKNHENSYETNIILGRHPSDAKVVGYFVSLAAVNMWLVPKLRPKYRKTLWIVVAVVQIAVMSQNNKAGIGFKF